MNKLLLLISAFFTSLLVGCGNAGTSAPPAEENHIRTLVGHTAEYQSDPRKFASCLAEGAIVDDALRKNLNGLMARLDHATIDDAGASATAYVNFEVLETGEQFGPAEWKLEKSGDQWKVKTLAIPELATTSAN